MAKISATPAARTPSTGGGASPTTELLAQTLSIAKSVAKGAKGMWPAKPLELLKAAEKILGPDKAVALLTSTLGVSQKVDEGAKGMWPTKVLTLLSQAKQIAAS
jgi:hypothetical protein